MIGENEKPGHSVTDRLPLADFYKSCLKLVGVWFKLVSQAILIEDRPECLVILIGDRSECLAILIEYRPECLVYSTQCCVAECGQTTRGPTEAANSGCQSPTQYFNDLITLLRA
ncbi:hypothetical protein J6590_017871 [Homalodisca vitripennis]|nr:hypothetical protein J6590_017871 [Homalodisca vitripennis]